jgi:rare lipoprotein A
MNQLRRSLLWFLLALFLQSCGSHIPQKTDSKLIGYEETGKASFYAMKFQFRKTASGDRFNQFAMTAAHKKLPFGTMLLVTNLENGKSVKVKVNDRGPFIKGRIIDLSRAAFTKIGDTGKGILSVKIKAVK